MVIEVVDQTLYTSSLELLVLEWKIFCVLLVLIAVYISVRWMYEDLKSLKKDPNELVKLIAYFARSRSDKFSVIYIIRYKDVRAARKAIKAYYPVRQKERNWPMAYKIEIAYQCQPGSRLTDEGIANLVISLGPLFDTPSWATLTGNGFKIYRGFIPDVIEWGKTKVIW